MLNTARMRAQAREAAAAHGRGVRPRKLRMHDLTRNGTTAVHGDRTRNWTDRPSPSPRRRRSLASAEAVALHHGVEIVDVALLAVGRSLTCQTLLLPFDRRAARR